MLTPKFIGSRFLNLTGERNVVVLVRVCFRKDRYQSIPRSVLMCGFSQRSAPFVLRFLIYSCEPLQTRNPIAFKYKKAGGHFSACASSCHCLHRWARKRTHVFFHENFLSMHPFERESGRVSDDTAPFASLRSLWGSFSFAPVSIESRAHISMSALRLFSRSSV